MSLGHIIKVTCSDAQMFQSVGVPERVFSFITIYVLAVTIVRLHDRLF